MVVVVLIVGRARYSYTSTTTIRPRQGFSSESGTLMEIVALLKRLYRNFTKEDHPRICSQSYRHIGNEDPNVEDLRGSTSEEKEIKEQRLREGCTFVLGQRTLLIRENFSCWNQTGACVPELIMPSGHDIAMELTFGARAQRSSLGSFGARA
uniref:Uncharacterized protein n=1 Tax=Vespula pensylvanica TaxID=30213 RepID=A0A834NHR4_VESPE|nr:hypothetical protein H0235_013232 [Vespula pensylvanica]